MDDLCSTLSNPSIHCRFKRVQLETMVYRSVAIEFLYVDPSDSRCITIEKEGKQMIITKEFLKSIEPTVRGESEKYSWNLYSYMREYTGFSLGAFKSIQGDIIIGHQYHDGVSGKELMSILRESRRGTEFWFDDYWKLKEDESFFNEYQRIGRCLMIPHDYQWYIGEEHRFTRIGNTRRCNWCGKWEHMTIHKKTKITREEVWK